MAQTATTVRATHPLARAAGIDVGVVVFTLGAMAMTFATGQGVAEWRNIVFPPVVMVLAGICMLWVVAEVKLFHRVVGDTPHQGTAVVEVLVAIVAFVIVAPMLLIMPFIVFGALV